MRRKLLAMASVAIILSMAALNNAHADPQGWWGPVIGDFTAGAIISGVYGPYVRGPGYDPRYSGSEYGPSYYGGTRYYYPPSGYPRTTNKIRRISIGQSSD